VTGPRRGVKLAAVRRIPVPAAALIALLLAAPAGAATERGSDGSTWTVTAVKSIPEAAVPAEERGGPVTAIPAEERGEADGAIVVINGDVSVPRGHFVAGVYIVHGDARIAGRVDNDVVVVSGDVLLSGRVDGSVTNLSGHTRLLPGATVGGNLNYGDERPVVSPAARVEGSIEKESWSDSLGVASFFIGFTFWLAGAVSALLLGALLLLIAPRAAGAIAAESRKRIGVTIAIGIAIAIALPGAAFIALITLVGAPLAIGIGLAMFPIAAVAYVASAWALGRAIVKPPRNPYLSLLVGVAILSVVAWVPIVGWLVGFAASVFGLGLIGGAIGAARRGPEAEPAHAGSE